MPKHTISLIKDKDFQIFIIAVVVILIGFGCIVTGKDGEVKGMMGVVLGYVFGKQRR